MIIVRHDQYLRLSVVGQVGRGRDSPDRRRRRGESGNRSRRPARVGPLFPGKRRPRRLCNIRLSQRHNEYGCSVAAHRHISAPSHHAQRQQPDRQNHGEHADNNPDVDQTDAHPNWIGGRASPLPVPNFGSAGWGFHALEKRLQAKESSGPNVPITRVPNRNLEPSQVRASTLQRRHLALKRKTTSPISTRSPSRRTTEP